MSQASTALNEANLKSTIAKLFTKLSRQKQNCADTEAHILALTNVLDVMKTDAEKIAKTEPRGKTS